MVIRFRTIPLLMALSLGSCEIIAQQQPSFEMQHNIVRALMIQQLDKAASLLEQLELRGVFSKMCSQLSSHTCKIFDEDTLFIHDEINQCREDIQIQRSLKPFLVLWGQQKKNHNVTTIPYLKEIAVLILTIYRAIYTACTPILQSVELEAKKTAFQTIAVLFSNIASLQAFELLNIIEKLTVQIPKLLEKYEITTGTLTWRQWIEKYWWLPPMAIAAVVFECAFIYQVATGSKKVPATALKTGPGFLLKQEKEAPCHA